MAERTVYKFALQAGIDKRITSGNPVVVHVGIDPKVSQHEPCVWVELTPNGNDVLDVTFIGTGHPVPKQMNHVGSCVAAGGALVWHVYAGRR